MREIKFRVWDTEYPERGMYQVPMDNYNTGDFFDTDRFVVMQYTGLKDGNGREIYEGDIVKCSVYEKETKDKVYWDDVGWRVDALEDFDLDFACKYIEVVGNIYENPELLEVSNE